MGKMKFQFESDLDFQTEAVNAVTGLFKDQVSKMAYFTVNGQSGFDYVDFTNEKPKDDNKRYGLGVANKLTLSSEEILKNLRNVQQFNKIAPAEYLNEGEYDFNIEMETGTGKTYVYLKTIFELNKLYGFTKFIIVVPSIAIKEGVYKTIQITKEHFKGDYENVIYDSFVYDSSKLEQVRNFAVNSNIQIMIINIDSFNKSFKDPSKEDKANIIHRENDKLSGYKPIQLIQETNPIVIIDEPQSVMGGKGEEAVASLNPLCTLRYSATHKDIQNLIYKLDAIDAYERHLVKGIEVAELEADEFHNKPYMKLISVSNKNGISAKVEVDVNDNGVIKRKPITVHQADELSEFKLTNRSIYDGYTVQHIHGVKGEEYVSFTNKSEILTIGNPVNSINEMTFKRAQINKTIEEHLDKERELNKKGIKVLSLFFIDKVANYRDYDEDGNPIKGIYAKMFEEEYEKVIKYPKYHWNDDVDVSLKAADVHEGYFSIDKTKSRKTGKNIFKDTKTTKKGKAKYNKDDEDTFNLIMRDKERLLSFDEPVKFIFSHSALREGWDNPNVFQICTLNETNSNIKKRQEIGRGLRLCVNQNGERIKNNSINTLTIMANESYEEFAKALQTEMEKETGIKFGVILRDSFAHITMKNKNTGEYEPIEKQGSLSIFNKFKEMHYIDKNGKVQEALKTAIDLDNVVVPERFESIKDQITEVAKQRTKKVEVKQAKKRKKAEFKEKIELSPEFKKLWNTIRRKTTYSVEFSTDELIEKCKDALYDELNIKSPKLFYTKSNLVINAAGVSVDEKGKLAPSAVYSNDEEIALPDIVKILQNETSLTRKTIIQILVQSKTLEQFKKNPQDYIDESIKIIKRIMGQMLIDGIKYTELDECYSQSLFTDDELSGYLDKNMVNVENSVYDYVVYDSEIEKNFALDLDRDPQVSLYTKLPNKFRIRTPIGEYNPDWAILFKEDCGLHKLYFIVETKGTDDIDSLRPSERNKIICGMKHFKAINENIQFSVTDKYNKFKRKDVL